MTGREILNLSMSENDAGATTIGGYLHRLLGAVWAEGEGFSGKRPFGNSGWEYELYRPLIAAGAVKGTVDEYGDITGFDEKSANRAIFDAIDALFEAA